MAKTIFGTSDKSNFILNMDLGRLNGKIFFGEAADSVRVNPVLYPDLSIIDRCALEHDWGQDTDKLLAMWSRVKGDNANSMTYIIIVVALAALAAGYIVSKKNKRGHKKHGKR